MNLSALKSIAEQLFIKKSQAEALRENFQDNARFRITSFFDYLLFTLDELANPHSQIANPIAHLEEEITKAKALYRMPNENLLADTVNECFNFNLLLSEADWLSEDDEEEDVPKCKRHRTAYQQQSSQDAAANLPASLSTMPNKVLDRILNKSGIPLSERILLRGVSPLFRNIIQESLRQEASLSVIVKDSQEVVKVMPDDLLIKEDSFEMAIQLLRQLFPGVTQLSLESHRIEVWRKAPELIRLYDDLEDITCKGVFKKIRNNRLNKLQKRKFERMFKSLNKTISSMDSLQSIDISELKLSGN